MAGPAEELARAGCSAIAARVEAVAGGGPAFIASWDSPDGKGAPPEPALNGAAFVYDNALAAIALTACGKPRQAARIAEALHLAAIADRAGPQGRLRNAYRAGPQPTPPPPHGWWSAAEGRWLEDAYQTGTATGNVAWTALALLTVAEATGDRRFADGAARLADWIVANAATAHGAGGFSGGVHGGEGGERRLTWKSTEHNADLVAAFAALRRARIPGPWRPAEVAARRFLDALWDEQAGRFHTGTTPDGVTPAQGVSGLDAQLLPLLLPDARPAWRRALDFAERAHGVDGGFDFNDDRDGLWVEGTAQAALVYRHLGRDVEADRLVVLLWGEAAPSGYLWATRRPRITTGLAIGPDSATDDFAYFRRPHLAPTAWAVLAALGRNPFQ